MLNSIAGNLFVHSYYAENFRERQEPTEEKMLNPRKEPKRERSVRREDFLHRRIPRDTGGSAAVSRTREHSSRHKIRDLLA